MTQKYKALIIKQSISFFNKYYRFPNFVHVGKRRVFRDEIVDTVEGILGRTFEWYKRKKVVAQLNDALEIVDVQ